MTAGPAATGRGRPKPLDLVITYDDDPAVAGDIAGQTVQVRAGQREMAAWELEPFGCSSTKAADQSAVLFFRYLGFRALWRTRQLPKGDDGRTVGWEAWSAMVESVEPPDDVDDDDQAGELPDPLSPDRSPAD